jgi:hypothetical protein
MLREFGLLVAPRRGVYEPPVHLVHAVRRLRLGAYDDFASTRVRAAVEGWESLVPAEILDTVRRLYRLS